MTPQTRELTEPKNYNLTVLLVDLTGEDTIPLVDLPGEDIIFHSNDGYGPTGNDSDVEILDDAPSASPNRHNENVQNLESLDPDIEYRQNLIIFISLLIC